MLAEPSIRRRVAGLGGPPGRPHRRRGLDPACRCWTTSSAASCRCRWCPRPAAAGTAPRCSRTWRSVAARRGPSRARRRGDLRRTTPARTAPGSPGRSSRAPAATTWCSATCSGSSTCRSPRSCWTGWPRRRRRTTRRTRCGRGWARCPRSCWSAGRTLTSSLMTEAPMGELEVERESASTEAVRDAEALQALQGRTKYNTVALDARPARWSPTPTSRPPSTSRGAPTSGAPWCTAPTAVTASAWRSRSPTCACCRPSAPGSTTWSPTTPRSTRTWSTSTSASASGPTARLGEFQKRLA